MSYYEQTLNLQKRYLSGEIQSLRLTKHPKTNELSKLGKKIRIGKGSYLLYGGSPGSGKTGIVDSEFILKTFIWWRREKPDIQLNFLYNSMERPLEMKIAKWICWLMFVEYNILIDVPTFFQWDNKIRELTEKEKSIISKYKEDFEEFEKYLVFKTGPDNPTGIHKFFKSHFLKKGVYIRSDDKKIFVNDKHIKSFGSQKDEKGIKYEIIRGEKITPFYNRYIEKDINNIFICINDHVGCQTREQGLSDKGILDKGSEYSRIRRDVFNTVEINIMQFNRNQEDIQRNLKTEFDVKKSDFAGSDNLYKDADIVIGMLNPYGYGIERNWRGVNISQTVSKGGYSRFRGMKVLKNSYGIDNFRINYLFLGEIGFVNELVKAEEMTDEYYNKLLKGDYLNL